MKMTLDRTSLVSSPCLSLLSGVLLWLSLALIQPASAAPALIVISQVYGGGGNSGATYKNDFIELHNIGEVAVSVEGWSVQYASGTGTTWSKTDLTGSVPAGGYYLIQEDAGSGGTVDLPTPDAFGSIGMSATAGKIALVNNGTVITAGTACPSDPSIIDFVGYGTSATCSETAPAPATSATVAIIRGPGGAAGTGCQDTSNNSVDFVTGAPNPRNAATAPFVCGSGCTSPTASVSGDATICNGSSTTIQAVLAGTGPWNVTWSDSVTQTGVTVSPATRDVSPTTTTAYTVTSVSDASGCPPSAGLGSATVTVTEPVTPAVSLVANPGTTTCANNEVVFTATPVNGGPSPTYVWRTNGIVDTSVPGNSATYTSSTLSNGETIDCQLTSSLSCVTSATADAPQLTMTITASVTPSVSIAANPGTTICGGTTVTFTATPVNGGALPNYVWKTNGVVDASVPANSTTYANGSLGNGDTVDCQLISSDICASPTTADAPQIVMTVNLAVAPSVTIVADVGSIICSGATVLFTATPVNGGVAPAYQWNTNGVAVPGQTAATFSTSNLKNLDAVTVTLAPSAEICVSPTTATSDPVVMTVNPLPDSTITTASELLPNATGNPASVPDAGVGATYVWTITGGTITAGQGTASLTYTAGAIGTLSLGCTITSSAGCDSVGTADVAVHAPILASWDVSALPGGTGNYGPSPLVPTTTDANLTVGGLTRGAGVVTSGNATPRAWGGTAWQSVDAATAITAEKFATFTITANAGASVSFNSISTFNYRRSGTGPAQGTIQYQVGGTDTFHDLTTVAYPITASTGGSLGPIDLSGVASLQNVAGGTVVTFRIVNFGGSSSAGTWYIYDVGNSAAADFEVAGYVSTCTAPTATLAGDATVCAGGAANLVTTLTGTQPWSVTWSDGVTSNNITSSPVIRTVNPSATTVYTVTSVSDALNCAAGTFSGSATVTVNPLPSVAVNSATVCAGGSAVLTAATSASNPSYLWSPGGETTASITVSPTATTVYSVTVTDGTTGCANSGSGTVTVNPLPSVAVNSATVCAGGSALLTATTSASNPGYLWSPGGETTASITVSPTTTTVYSVTVTDGATGCANSGSGTVTVSDTPVVTTDTTNQTTCAGSVVTWSVAASGSGLTYQWQRDGTNLVEGVDNFTGVTTASLTNSGATDADAVDEVHGYACIVMAGTCTTSSTLVSLSVNPLPSVAVNSDTVCAGGSALLTATTSASNPSYLWSPGGETTASITVSPSATTAYSVTVTDGTTGCANNGSGTVTINPLPSVAVNSATVCASGSAVLTATTSASNPSYLWSPGGETTASITVSPAATTVYSVTVTDGTTGCANTGSGTVTVNPLPTVAVNSATVCAGGSAVLTATTSASNPSYLWSPGGETTASITVSPAATTVYSVTVTDGTTGCANTGSGTVTVNPLPSVAVNSATVCAGGSAVLTATTSASNPSYLWSPGGEMTASITVSPTTTIVYSVTVTDGTTGCANSGSGTVTVSDTPVVTTDTTNQTTCAGSVVTWSVAASGSGLTYQWQRDGTNLVEGVDNFTGVTTASLTNSSATDADAVDEVHGYACIVMAGTCTTSSTLVSLSVNPLPSVAVNSDTVCAGGSALLTATTSASNPSYLWSPGGETTASITVSPTATTVYSVTVTDGATGCANSGSGTVTVSDTPVVTTDTTNQTACAGSVVTWSVAASGSGLTYQWQRDGTNLVEGVDNFTGVTTASLTNSGTTDADAVDEAHGYACIVMAGTCTTSSTLVSLSVNPLPTVSVNSAAVCAGGSALLTALTSASNPSYLWSPGGETTASITVSPTATTVYSVTVTDGTTGCANSGSSTVIVNPLPSVFVDSDTICAGGSAVLTATTSASNPSYLWSPGGETTASITVSPVTTTIYTVTVTDGTTGCQNSDQAPVVVNPLPYVFVDTDTICEGESGTLTVTTSASNPSYLWSPGGETTASITVSPTTTTIYTVVVTDGTTGCENGDWGAITVNPRPTVAVSPTTTNITCGGAVTFTAEPSGEEPFTYQWYDNRTNAIAGATNLTLTVSNVDSAAAGNYTIIVTGPHCSAAGVASLTVEDTTPPVIAINGENPVTNECHMAYTDAGVTVSDACAGSVNVSTNSSVNANVPGVYTVVYTADDGNGNTNTATRTVYVVDTTPPIITILGANPYTNFAFVTFVDPGATATDACAGPLPVTVNGTVDVTVPGAYTLEYVSTDASGNAVTNSRVVQVIPLESPAITSGQKLADGSFTVTFSGPRGQPYQLLSSDDATRDMSEWTVLLTGTFGTGPLTYTDTTAASSPARYYRVVSP